MDKQKKLEIENLEKEKMKNRIDVLEQQIKVVQHTNKVQAEALKQSNKLMEEILNMQKTDKVHPEFLSSTLYDTNSNMSNIDKTPSLTTI